MVNIPNNQQIMYRTGDMFNDLFDMDVPFCPMTHIYAVKYTPIVLLILNCYPQLRCETPYDLYIQFIIPIDMKKNHYFS